MNLLNALKNINGEFELTRIAGAIGTAVFVATSSGYEGYDVIYRGVHFDVAAYCLAFPAGLATCVGAIAGAAKWKDKGVEEAKVIRDTGAAPGEPAS
jgi:hypothetical protein